MLKSGDVLKNGATVLDFDPVARIVLANWGADGKFVTWAVDPDGATYWGHYFSTFEHAANDYKKRTGQRKKNPCKKKVTRKKNPKDSARVFHDNDKLKTVYSVEFWGDEWVIFTNTDYGSRILSRYGAGDAGRNKATKHLAQIKANKKARKKNPEIEVRELILWAENDSKLQNQFMSIMKNLSRKHKKGTYDPVLAAKLWKYWIDEAVKNYNREVLGGGYSLRQSVFTVQDRKDAAIEVEEQWRDDVRGGEYLKFTNPSRRKKKKKKATRKKNSVGAVKPRGFLVASFAPVYNDVVYALDSKGARMDFRKANAKVWKTQNGAAAAAVDIANGWGEPVVIAPTNTSVKQIESYFPGVRKRGKAKRGRNPVGPTQREIDSAGELFRDFTGEHPERMKNVKLPVPKTGLVIGELDGVLYTTVRDGKTEAYQHDFKKGSRPLLASSHDGKSLHVLGGEYEFTERGIEDK